MTSQVFYRKWRPQSLAEVVGQEAITRTLLGALTQERLSHAYLFCGPRGTGKTSTGRILAKAVNCLTNGKGEPCNTCAMCTAITEGKCLDVIEIDAASNRRIDEIRELRERVNYAPNQARYKVYIIDEVHMLTNEAANALLKTLEEPPPHVIFILATTEAHKMLPTILSRCQRFDFRRLSLADVTAKLAHICESEGIKMEPEALTLVARAATGSLRDAENLLQQLNTYYGTEVSLEQARATLGISDDLRARELVKHLVGNDIPAGIAAINSVNADGLDLRQFNREVTERLRALLLVKTGTSSSVDLPAEEIKELEDLARQIALPQILQAVKIFGQMDIRLDNYSTLPLELALVDSTMPVAEPAKAQQATARPEPETAPPLPRPTAKTTAPPPDKTVKTEAKTGATAQAEKTAARPAPEKAPPEPAPVKEATTAAREEPVVAGEKAAADKEAPITAEEKPVAASALAAGSPIEQLRAQWVQIINDAPGGLAKTPAAALLRSGSKPLEIQEDTIILSFKYASHKENMEKNDNQKTAEKIISNFLGRACRVRCVYEHENNHLVKAALDMGARHIDTEEA